MWIRLKHLLEKFKVCVEVDRFDFKHIQRSSRSNRPSNIVSCWRFNLPSSFLNTVHCTKPHVFNTENRRKTKFQLFKLGAQLSIVINMSEMTLKILYLLTDIQEIIKYLNASEWKK